MFHGLQNPYFPHGEFTLFGFGLLHTQAANTETQAAFLRMQVAELRTQAANEVCGSPETTFPLPLCRFTGYGKGLCGTRELALPRHETDIFVGVKHNGTRNVCHSDWKRLILPLCFSVNYGATLLLRCEMRKQILYYGTGRGGAESAVRSFPLHPSVRFAPPLTGTGDCKQRQPRA